MRTAAFIAPALLVCVVACGSNDPDYDTRAETALDRAGFENLSASYDEQAQVVHITGAVGTTGERELAGEAVEEAVAPAQVANEVTIQGPPTETADDLDSGLSTRLSTLIEQDAALAAAKIAFEVNNGVVTITGRVPTVEQKDRVGQMARNQPGVRDVVNSLEVGQL